MSAASESQPEVPAAPAKPKSAAGRAVKMPPTGTHFEVPGSTMFQAFWAREQLHHVKIEELPGEATDALNSAAAHAESEAGDVPAPPAGSVEERVLKTYGLILIAARKHGVPPALIAATIEVESGGEPSAVSEDRIRKGLLGLDERRCDLARTYKAFEPPANIVRGAELIRFCLDAFPGDERAAIAAYDAGIVAVRQALAARKPAPGAATRVGYVEKVEKARARYEPYFPER